LAPFDPFAILGLEHGATDRDIKKAYRKLSLQFHPDKNPDPKAAAYFASHIAKAYAALTDPISRENYEKYGHPDGPQGMNVGVALPEWMFTKDRKMAPLMLLGLVGGGVLLPMALAAWHLFNGQKYSGPNKIMNETYSYLWHSPFKVKEVQVSGVAF
jgi:translocation protein SEC63